MRRLRNTVPIMLAVFVAVGCGEDAPPNAPDDGRLRTNHTTPAGLVGAYERCLIEKNLDAYAELLHADFEYHNDRLGDFSWVPEEGWDLATELGILANMFDTSYISPETGESLGEIQAQIENVHHEQALRDGELRTVVTTHFVTTSLWGFGWGAYTDSHMVFDLVPDESGFLRIRRLEEINFGFAAGRDAPIIATASWTVVKAMYQ